MRISDWSSDVCSSDLSSGCAALRPIFGEDEACAGLLNDDRRHRQPEPLLDPLLQNVERSPGLLAAIGRIAVLGAQRPPEDEIAGTGVAALPAAVARMHGHDTQGGGTIGRRREGEKSG